MQSLPWKPSVDPQRSELAKPSSSCVSIHARSIGASMPAARLASASALRKARSSVSSRDQRMFMSSVKSPAPNASRFTRGDARALACADQPVRALNLLRPVDLGRHYSVDPALHDRAEIAVAELRRERIDPHVAERAPRLLKRRDDHGACRHLL